MLFNEYLIGLDKNKKVKSKYENAVTFNNELAGLITDSLHRYKWDNLPETVSERMLELSFLYRGWAGIFRIENGALVTLLPSPDGSLNLYGDPTGAWGYGLNGYNRHFSVYVKGADDAEILKKSISGVKNSPKPEGVIGRSNKLGYPDIFILVNAAERIADAARTLDTIARNLKHPAIIQTEDRAKNSVEQIFNSRDNNDYLIIGDGGLPFESLKVMDIGMPAGALSEIWEYRENIINETREKLGIISNPEADKKERLLTDEINANNTQTFINLDKGLHARQEFADAVNAVFDTDIKVGIDSHFTDAKNYDTIKEEEEDDENYEEDERD